MHARHRQHENPAHHRALTHRARHPSQAFCTRNGVATTAVRFLFDGNRINPSQTPEDLEMEDNDVIDVMVEQQGGK